MLVPSVATVSKAIAAEGAGRRQGALRVSLSVSAAAGRTGAGVLGAGSQRAEAQALELSTRRSHTLLTANLGSRTQDWHALGFSTLQDADPAAYCPAQQGFQSLGSALSQL